MSKSRKLVRLQLCILDRNRQCLLH